MAVPVTVGAPLKVTLFGNYNLRVVTNNVFWVKLTTGSLISDDNTAINVARGLWAALKGPLLGITTTAMRYTSVLCEVLDASGASINGEAYTIPTAEQAGSAGVTAHPPFNAATYRLVRPNTSFRHGYKRFAGMAEDLDTNGVVASPASQTALDAIAAAIFAPFDMVKGAILDGSDDPIVSSECQIFIQRAVVNGDPLATPEYIRPSAVIFNGFGSQNTRKFGSGV